LAPELAPDNAERAGKRSDLGGLSLRRYSRKTGQNVTPSDGQGRRSHALPLHADHRDTNNEELDPDHWVAVQGPFKVLFRCLTIAFWYNQYFWKHIAFHAHIPGMRPLTIHIAVMYLILYGIALSLAVFGWWREVLALWIVPHILASALIIYFFAYLTHKPHEVHERYRDTNVFWVKGRIIEAIVNWLYMFQNFHLIHHLFPRIPFYLYPNAFRSLKPVLEKEHAHIYEYEFGR
jgi:beta-carotene hydroxylase